MCSIRAGVSPTSLAGTLHEVLDGLLEADLTALSAAEHRELVTSLVRARHRLEAASADAVAAFDSADVASTTRHRTTKQWLAHRTPLSLTAASYLTTTARALRDHLPQARDALATGAISAQHVSAITTVVRKVGPEHAAQAEPILLGLARRCDPATVRQATAAIFAHINPDGAERALRDAYEKRGVTLNVVGEHGYLDGVFDLESTELLMSVLMPLMTPAGASDTRTTPQRRADALLDIAQKHLDTTDMPQLGGHRPHLSIVVDADRLPPAEDAAEVDQASPVGPDGTPRGWLGTIRLPWTNSAIPASTARRWACDASVTPIVARVIARPRQRMSGDEVRDMVATGSGLPFDPAWVPLDVGRTQRVATPALLKALALRDGGCVHPGCSRTTVYCQAHHVHHWQDGGATNSSNLVMLCRHHHRTLHQGLWSIRPDPSAPGLFWTTDADGLHQAQTATDRSPPLHPVG